MHYATSDWYTPHRAPTHYFQLAPTATVSSLLYICSIYFLAIFISYFVLFLSLQIFKCKDVDQAKASGGLPAPAMRNCSLYSLPLSWFLSRFPKFYARTLTRLRLLGGCLRLQCEIAHYNLSRFLDSYLAFQNKTQKKKKKWIYPYPHSLPLFLISFLPSPLRHTA